MRKVFDIYLRTAILFPSIHYEEDGLLDKLRYLSFAKFYSYYLCIFLQITHIHVINQNSLIISLQENLSKSEIISL